MRRRSARRISVLVLGCLLALVKKIFECQKSFMVGDNCVQRGYVHSKNEFVLAWKIEIAKRFERMISVFDI